MEKASPLLEYHQWGCRTVSVGAGIVSCKGRAAIRQIRALSFNCKFFISTLVYFQDGGFKSHLQYKVHETSIYKPPKKVDINDGNKQYSTPV